MKIIVHFILLILAAISLYAQTPTGSISGTVIDARTKEPLIAVNVLVLDTSFGAATDTEGRFNISRLPVGSYRLRFNYIGYISGLKTDIVVKSAQPAVVNIELEQSVLEGKNVLVTAGYFVEESKAQPSVIGLSREEIRRFPGGFEDVVRTVSTLPGVAINNAGGRNDLLVRGGGPAENLFTINGIEVPNINHFGTQGTSSGSLSFVNLDFVQDVTFSTGGFSARYGDKLSSVLSLTMTDAHNKHWEPKLSIAATQYGFDIENALGNNGNFIFSARRSYLDLIFKAAGLSFIPVYSDFNLIAHYDLSPRDKLFLISLSAIDNVDRDLTTLKNRVENSGIMGSDQYQAMAGINYRRVLNWGFLETTVSTNLFKYGFKQADPHLQEFFRSDAREREINANIVHYWVASKTFGVRTGVASKTILYKNNIAFADTIYDRNGNKLPITQLGVSQNSSVAKTARKFAGFTEIDWTLTPQLELNLGGRVDHYGFIDKKTYLSPRLALQYKLTPRHSLKLSGGTYYQSPSYVWVNNDVNSRLTALRNNMGVLGWEFLIEDDVRFSVETYYKKYDHLPTGTSPGVTDYIVISNTGTNYGGSRENFQSFGYFDMVSQGRGRSYGAEFLVQKKFSSTPYYGLASLSLNKSEVTAKNGLTYFGQYDQRVIFNLSGGYKPNSKWEFTAKFRYFSGVPYTPLYIKGKNPKNPDTIENLPEEYLTARVKPGHHMDIRIDRYFNFNRSTITIYVDIQNVYNNKIPLRPDYNFWNNTIDNNDQIGVLPSIGVSWEL
jgi:hypothetical protein